MQPKLSTIIVNSKLPFTAQPHSILSVWQPTMSIFQCFLVVKIMLIYAKILLKTLQTMNSKNFHVASDHSIQKIVNKIGMDVDIATQK